MEPAIAIGANIFRHRKESRLTQGDLARHLGVTKASVSKWETGQSYPDIELLPKIATYFGITIDELIGYEPQMSRENIQRECARLREAFATEPFEVAHDACRQLVRDYYSCYPLIVQIALLYLNHLDLAEPSKREELASESIGLCRRIRRHSDSPADVRQAESLEASLQLAIGNPQAAVEALGDARIVDMGTDILLANAYGALGKAGEADKILQGALFQSTVLNLNRLAQLGMLLIDNPSKLDAVHKRANALIDTFDLEDVYVNTAAIHLSFAIAFCMGGDTDRALDCLEDYERASAKLDFPIKLHGDAFFDKIESWLEDINVVGTSAPRDDALNRKSLVESVANNPVFVSLADNPRFRRVVKSLEEITQ